MWGVIGFVHMMGSDPRGSSRRVLKSSGCGGHIATVQAFGRSLRLSFLKVFVTHHKSSTGSLCPIAVPHSALFCTESLPKQSAWYFYSRFYDAVCISHTWLY